jgi:hypothetical protein
MEPDGPVILGIAPCCVCGNSFAFDPDRVLTVRIDPETSRPPDVDSGGQHCEPSPEALARSAKQPVCPGCARLLNARLRARGQEPAFDETDTAAALYG